MFVGVYQQVVAGCLYGLLQGCFVAAIGVVLDGSRGGGIVYCRVPDTRLMIQCLVNPRCAGGTTHAHHREGFLNGILVAHVILLLAFRGAKIRKTEDVVSGVAVKRCELFCLSAPVWKALRRGAEPCKCGSRAVQVSLVSRTSVSHEPCKCPANGEQRWL